MKFNIVAAGNVQMHSEIPKDLSDQLCLAGHVFYPLPMPLVDALERCLFEVIGNRAVSDERKIAKLADERGAAAFRDGDPIQFQYLVDRNPPLTIEILRAAGSKVPEKAFEEFGGALPHHFRYAQAYCGWLVSQSEYWTDLDELVSSEHSTSSKLPAPKPAILGGSYLPVAREEQAVDVRAYKRFYEKWRLQTLATHDLPVCVSPQLTATTVYASNAPAGTINPVIPDIFPIDGKGIVSKSLEAASQNVHAPYLESWKDLICSTSRTKKKLDTYCRRFVLQHYWRVLTQRYRDALSRKTMLLDKVFGDYFDVSVDMIRSDRSDLDMLLDRPLADR